nr:hydantoinase B/oxoprolinase family protein [Paraburkholderia sprentiae]
MIAPSGEVIAPYGLQGGQPGAVHHYTIEQGGETVTLGSKDANATLMPGAVLTLRSAGGGGFGDPRLREPSLVKRDLDYGYVTG